MLELAFIAFVLWGTSAQNAKEYKSGSCVGLLAGNAIEDLHKATPPLLANALMVTSISSA